MLTTRDYASMCTILIRFCRFLYEKNEDSWFKGFFVFNEKINKLENLRLVLELVGREPSPIVEYLNGEHDLKRIELEGKGTKKEPYKAVWSKEYYR